MNTSYLNNKRLDNEYRGQTWTPPASMYLSYLIAPKGKRAAFNSAAVALNDLVALVTNANTVRLYKVTTAGTLAAAQSTLYPGVAGEVIVDGTATLTEQSNVIAASASGIPSVCVEPALATGGYNRVTLAASLAAVNATQGGAGSASSGTTGTVTNVAQITFGTPSTDWFKDPVVAWAIGRFDAASAGNLLEVCPIVYTAFPAHVKSGDQPPIIPAASLSFSLA